MTLHDLLADAEERVQRRHGILKDHSDSLSPDAAHRAAIECGEVLPFEPDGSAGDSSCSREEPQNGQAGHRLSGSGLAHDAEGLPGGEIKTNAFDGGHHAVTGSKFHPQVANGELWFRHSSTLLARGSSASRRPSPRKFKQKSISASGTAGAARRIGMDRDGLRALVGQHPERRCRRRDAQAEETQKRFTENDKWNRQRA